MTLILYGLNCFQETVWYFYDFNHFALPEWLTFEFFLVCKSYPLVLRNQYNERKCSARTQVTTGYNIWQEPTPLRWRHNGRDSVSNHQPHDCLFNRLFRRRSKKTSKLRVTGLCAGNSPGTGEFPAQMASNADNVSIWWRHHENQLEFRMWWVRYPQSISIIYSSDHVIGKKNAHDVTWL